MHDPTEKNISKGEERRGLILNGHFLKQEDTERLILRDFEGILAKLKSTYPDLVTDLSLWCTTAILSSVS